MNKIIKIKVWLLFLIAVLSISAVSIWSNHLRYQSPHYLASKYSGLNVPLESEVYYFRNTSSTFPSESTTIIVLKIPDSQMSDFQQQVSENEYETIEKPVTIRGFRYGNYATYLEEGFFKYESATKNSYYDAKKGILYVMRMFM